MELTWTHNKPTESGWYWWRLDADDGIVEFFVDGNGALMVDWGNAITSPNEGAEGMEWAGPIAEPKPTSSGA